MITWQLIQSPMYPDVWYVEGDKPGDNGHYMAMFCGPDAKGRAEDYYHWITYDDNK